MLPKLEERAVVALEEIAEALQQIANNLNAVIGRDDAGRHHVRTYDKSRPPEE